MEERKKLTLAAFNAGCVETYIKDSNNFYKLHKDTSRTTYILHKGVEGKISVEEHKYIKTARAEVNKLRTFFNKPPKPDKVERQKLYKISIGVRRDLQSKGFYRDVAHYREENKQFPKNTCLRKSAREDGWVYADTMTQD